MESMECGGAILRLSSTPLREGSSSSSSTSSSSVHSGTDAAPSSRTSLGGQWIDLVAQTLEAGRGKEEAGEETNDMYQINIEKNWEGAVLENIVACDVKVRGGSREGILSHHIPLEKDRATSGYEIPLTRSWASRLRRHHVPLTFILSLILASYTSSPYTLIPLAVFGITSFVRILIRAIRANPIIRTMALTHIAWKASTLRMQYPIIFVILSTSFVAVRPLLNSSATASTPTIPTKGNNSMSHSLMCPDTGEPWAIYVLVKSAIKILVVTSIMVASALPLCCIYSIWDHAEPVFLTVFSLVLFALSQALAEISQEMRGISPVTGGDNMSQTAEELTQRDHQSDLSLGYNSPDDRPPPSFTGSCSYDNIGAQSSTRPAIIMTAIGLTIQCIVCMARGVAACAWLLLWGELDAHRVVMCVVKVHHHLLV